MGCNSPTPLPRTVSHSQGRKPVDSAREFLEQRHKALNETLDGFVRYREAVIDRKKALVESELVWANAVMDLEQNHPTPKMLQEFIDSPEGAYLSAQDKDFLDRLKSRYGEQIRDRFTAIGSDEDSRRIPSRWSHDQLFTIYGRLEAIRRFIQELDQATITGLVLKTVEELAPADRDMLIRSVKEASVENARALRTDAQASNWLSRVADIQPTLESHRSGFIKRAEVERRLIELIIIQALFFSPFQLDNAAVAGTRFNDFAEPGRNRLDRMVVDELRRR
ncbi:MAG: hypothetical protein CTY25_12015 [Methylobacterium sp.]|nr:MAG: hypothetical protein CTY25_12015 [Methylobacterium sp.]